MDILGIQEWIIESLLYSNIDLISRGLYLHVRYEAFTAFLYLLGLQPCQDDVTILGLSSTASLGEQQEKNWKIGFPVPLMESEGGTFFLLP
jgi:hypothetical protein